ncbi:MAG: AAA family ATPase, partial [Treponema sp.]|nr:AAA family ATPase [Treponema sp.]
MEERFLPIGIQDFEKLRRGNHVYVDKTALIYKLAQTSTPYFLSRPRRFGKSLLVTTLEAYFQGRKELFDGLAIGELEKNWKQYPVLHIDLNAAKYTTPQALISIIDGHLRQFEQSYGKV